MSNIGEWFNGLPTWGKVGVVAGGGGLVLFIWRPWQRSAPAPTAVSSFLPEVSSGNPMGGQTQTDISGLLANERKTTEDMLSKFSSAQSAQQSASQASQADMLSKITASETNQANALHQEMTSQMTAFNAIVASLDHPANHATDPVPVPHYTPPVVQPIYTPPIVQPLRNWTDYSSASQTQYNPIGGGSTDAKPANTTLANGNSIKYDNGPHGWTEYNSSGEGVRWGTSTPY